MISVNHEYGKINEESIKHIVSINGMTRVTKLNGLNKTQVWPGHRRQD